MSTMARFDPTHPLPAGVTLLEASAGTGKTHAITDIVLRLVAVDGVPVERILTVTFTEAATAELRDRVRRRLRDAWLLLERELADAAAAAPGTLEAWLLAEARAQGTAATWRDRLRTALGSFGDAPIHTIHGWCARLLRDHAFECGAAMEAELLTELSELTDELVRDWWATRVATMDAAAFAALRAAGRLDCGRLTTLATRVLRRAEVVVHAGDAEGAAVRLAGLADARARCADALVVAYAAHADALAPALHLLKADKLISWQVAYIDSRLRELATWVAAPAAPPPKQLQYFTTAHLGDEAAATHAALHAVVVAADAMQQAQAELDACVDAAAAALDAEFAGWVRAEFASRTRARGLRTYDDLLRQVRDALRDLRHGGTLARRIREVFPVALVDEFQDTDGVQWEIFRTLFAADGARLAIIGDPKQAIYGFRGADVHAYLDAAAHAAERRSLAHNWRSDPALVHAVGHLYARLDQPFATDGIGWEDVDPKREGERLTGLAGAPLRLQVLARAPQPAAEPIAEPPRAGKAKKASAAPTVKVLTKGEANGRLARAVAADIVRFLRSGARFAPGHGDRAVAPGDCAVLVRTRQQARLVQAALRRLDVPSVLRVDESVYGSDEARDLTQLLAAVLDPADARLARAALATDSIGIPVARAHESAHAEAPGTLGPGDLLARLDGEGDEAERWAERLRKWLGLWERRGFMPMYRAVLADLAVAERLVALPDGERRLTNLLHLGELLHGVSVTERLAPSALLERLRRERQEPDGGREERRLRLESDADAVQLVTIHASKGLEYAATWVPWAWDGRLVRGSDADLPIVREDVPGGARHLLDLAPGAKARHEGALAAAALAEELRLLYVALTRARHRCTVYWGAIRDAETSSLGYLLYAPGAEHDPARARPAATAAIEDASAVGDDALRAPLAAMLDDSMGRIEWAVADESPVAAWATPDAGRTPPQAARWSRPAPLDLRWRVGSFTWMTRTRGGAAAPDESAPESLADARRGAAGPVEEAGVDGPPAQLVEFPASAAAGICLHDILEVADFQRPEALPPVVERVLLRRGFDARRWRDPVALALRAAFDAPLAAGAEAFRLADVPLARRLSELEFTLPVFGGRDAGAVADDGGVATRAAIARAFRDHADDTVPASYADAVERLGFHAFHGFLTGTMDLVTEHAGRWWVIDWKSNHLGARRADYAPERLRDEMIEAHYLLQYHLYVVALDRWLAWRVPGYEYERDMGGVRYLFLRGMTVGSDGRTGVFADRPPLARIRALGRALGVAAPHAGLHAEAIA